MHVRWHENAAAALHGQLVFATEVLAATGLFELWVSSCPQEYRSNSPPDKRNVLGTLMQQLLTAHRRNAYITALHGDSGCGNEGILLTQEERTQSYLLWLRQPKNGQHSVAQQFSRQDWSRPDNQGCQMAEASV